MSSSGGDSMAGPALRVAVVNGVTLRYVEAGEGPLVVLLHGFPEHSHCWRRQVPALTAAGFRVLAPDLRGFNESGKPRGVGSYRLRALGDDVVALIRLAGTERAAVVGHDWGGLIAWHVAMHHPEAVERLAILNAPHPAAFRRELASVVQLLRSWYVFFFQLPWLPEMLLRAGDFALFDRALRTEPVHRGAYTEEDIRLYKEAMRRPGALTAMVHRYRALFWYPRDGLPVRTIHAPTLLIWGERDRYLNAGLSRGLRRWVSNIRVERLADSSHWVPNDAPGRVNEMLVGFLKG